MKKIVVNPESKYILIDTEKCFQIDLKTAVGDEIFVGATIDGEYRKDLLVSVQEEGSNVLISVDFQPNFVNPNDKLSAHKVLSIALDVTLPKYVDAHVFGTNSNVNITGRYKKLKIDLADGNCTLDNVGENVRVKTQSGDIYLKNCSGVVSANSQYGRVFGNNVTMGDNRFNLQSIEGNIHIIKTE